ncbi:uncharacterized protein LOC115729104 [Rhodamnia argentea]|uniref:Uncharacterized protein LOC115729104 n=1 Tax=Rhodamnia argentea TaxID=178133 RepID=A0A8B8MZ73_9MYRT|nr:uncharacterized protein LOC115729104 [Rhodamnia argentea]
MGGVLSKAANSVGAAVGNAVAAPFKTIFGGSCEELCSGPWDVVCFIEHLCVTNLIKLLLICVLCYIALLFLYLLFKLGICQCIGRSLCNMCWAACETYWHALAHICCFGWYKITSTKRVYRGRHRFRDFEAGHSLSDITDDYSSRHLSTSRKRKLLRERTEGPLASYSNHSRRHRRHHHHRHVKLKSRRVSFASGRGSWTSRISRPHQISTLHAERRGGTFKRRRVR